MRRGEGKWKSNSGKKRETRKVSEREQIWMNGKNVKMVKGKRWVYWIKKYKKKLSMLKRVRPIGKEWEGMVEENEREIWKSWKIMDLNAAK